MDLMNRDLYYQIPEMQVIQLLRAHHRGHVWLNLSLLS